MKKFIIISFYLIFISGSVIAENIESSANNLFHIGQMNSHNKNFALFFKTRDKAILARGEDYNYVTDFPQDLYIYNYETKISSPLISYEWFPSQAKHLLEGYDYPVASANFSALKICKSSSFSPSPRAIIGSLYFLARANKIPPFAVPSNFVIIKPVRGIILLNSST